MFEISLEVKFLVLVDTVEQTKLALIIAKIVEYLSITHVALMKFKFNSFLHDTSIYIRDKVIHVKSRNS